MTISPATQSLSQPSTHSSCVSIQGKTAARQDRLQLSCHSCPLCTRCNPLPPQGLCLQSNAWIFPLQKHCHGKYPAHPSPLGLLKSVLQAWWADHTSSNNGWHCRQDSRRPHSEHVDQTPQGLPFQARSFRVWLSCKELWLQATSQGFQGLFLPCAS